MMRHPRRLAAAFSVMTLALAGGLSTGWSQSPPAPRQTDPAATDRPAPERKAPSVLPLPESGTTTDWRASQLIGTTMTNILGEQIGTVGDVVIDADGKVVAVMVSVGGFLGLGETSVAIGLRHLVIAHTDVDRLEVKTSLSRTAIEQAASLDPEMDRPVTP